jgi:Protein of unknown function (DUF992)
LKLSSFFGTVNNNGESLMKKIIAISMLALGLASTASDAGTGVKVGVLTCRVEGGAGFLIGSAKGVDCTYKPAGGGHSEHYSGSIGKFGIDIGVTNDAVLAWAVFAPGGTQAGALKGSYAGIGAEATPGIGIGANLLIGGFRKTINLQPLSVQAQTGLNISAGIASMTLRYDR